MFTVDFMYQSLKACEMMTSTAQRKPFKKIKFADVFLAKVSELCAVMEP